MMTEPHPGVSSAMPASTSATSARVTLRRLASASLSTSATVRATALAPDHQQSDIAETQFS